MRNFDNARIEAARAELVQCGGYIVNMPLGVADDGCFTPSAAAMERASGLTVKHVTVSTVTRSAVILTRFLQTFTRP